MIICVDAPINVPIIKANIHKVPIIDKVVEINKAFFLPLRSLREFIRSNPIIEPAASMDWIIFLDP